MESQSKPNDDAEDVAENLEGLRINDGQSRAAELVQQCRKLLHEMDTFEAYLASHGQAVELRHFKSSVKTECKLLEKLAKADPSAPRTAHTLRSSNFPFYAQVWDAAKQCEGVVALEKRFHWSLSKSRTRIPGSRNAAGSGSASGPASPAPSQPASPAQGKPHKSRTSVLVDIVASAGLEWVKVSTLTEKRMLFDIAKAGRVAGDSEFSSDSGGASDDDDDVPDGLLRQAEGLVKASQAARIRYRNPRIRIVLPRIGAACVKGVEDVLAQIEGMGITVMRADDVAAAPDVEDVLGKMRVDEYAHFTPTINIDCTILLSLVSSLSHLPLAAQPWHHSAVAAQIVREKADQLLPSALWPACGNRRLVCTKEAQQRMLEIVQLIGTDDEKLRTDLLIGGGRSYSREERIRRLQELSSHRIPADLQLPIEVVDVDIAALEREIGTLAGEVREEAELTGINQSVFFYGWARGLTTISSNRTVAKSIERVVEARMGGGGEGERGPDVWVCGTARSLVGKEKVRRDGKGLGVAATEDAGLDS